MNRTQQLFDQISRDLEISNLDPDLFSIYIKSLAVTAGLMQKLIKTHDLQISDALVRYQAQEINLKN